MLSDNGIQAAMIDGDIDIWPPIYPEQLQPCSVDLHVNLEEDYFLCPGEFLLWDTLELITLSDRLAAQVMGKSSWARLGLIVESAGLIDPGFEGSITLEIKNISQNVIKIPAGSMLCQVTFDYLDSPASRKYGHPELNSHYQGQRGPTKSWMDTR